ncbi:uncharacterized [Tachysurus ichikawai]
MKVFMAVCIPTVVWCQQGHPTSHAEVEEEVIWPNKRKKRKEVLTLLLTHSVLLGAECGSIYNILITLVPSKDKIQMDFDRQGSTIQGQALTY